jgi:hypothetical protein
VILKVLDCFDIALQRARTSGAVSREVFEPFVDFFRGFADKCHHCKEEDRLFPCLEEKGIPREGGPIGVMLLEHQQGRQRVRTIADELESADAGDAVAIEAVLDQGQKFLELLRGHIDKKLRDRRERSRLSEHVRRLPRHRRPPDGNVRRTETLNRASGCHGFAVKVGDFTRTLDIHLGNVCPRVLQAAASQEVASAAVNTRSKYAAGSTLRIRRIKALTLGEWPRDPDQARAV